jgi:hypothetical protein
MPRCTCPCHSPPPAHTPDARPCPSGAWSSGPSPCCAPLAASPSSAAAAAAHRSDTLLWYLRRLPGTACLLLAEHVVYGWLCVACCVWLVVYGWLCMAGCVWLAVPCLLLSAGRLSGISCFFPIRYSLARRSDADDDAEAACAAHVSSGLFGPYYRALSRVVQGTFSV